MFRRIGYLMSELKIAVIKKIKNYVLTCRLYSIPTSVLTRGPPSEFQQLPISLVGRKSSQGVGLTVNELDDTIYFSPLTETSISSWNPATNDQR